jgi:hypothetical protein
VFDGCDRVVLGTFALRDFVPPARIAALASDVSEVSRFVGGANCSTQLAIASAFERL